jgi:lipoprotein-anchoring transpeptidase ErfK/SrfK
MSGKRDFSDGGLTVTRGRRVGAVAVGVAAVVALIAGCSDKTSGSGTTGGAGGSGGSAGSGGGAAGSAAVKPASVSISPAGSDAVNPRSPVTVTVADGTLSAVVMTNPSGKQVAGSLSADKKTWTSSEPLGYGTSYQVAATAAGAGGGPPTQQSATVKTLSPKSQAYPSLLPPPSQTSVGIGQPLVVQFDKTITDKAAAVKALEITSDPPQTGAWHWISDKQVDYRPKEYWQPGTTVNLKVNTYGVNLGGGVYGQTDRTETVHVHDSWVAKADGKSEQMQIFQNGNMVKSMPISLGSKQYPTHLGTHVISDKQPSVTMDSCTYGVCQGQPGYYKETVLLDERISNDGEFVHEAPWSVGQQGSSNVSHGCVNLSPENAQWFFDHFGLGDVVEVTNSGGGQLPIYDTYGDWALSWADWSATS